MKGRKAETIKIPWDPFPNAPEATPPTGATPVTKADAQAIGAALVYLSEKRAAARRGAQ